MDLARSTPQECQALHKAAVRTSGRTLSRQALEMPTGAYRASGVAGRCRWCRRTRARGAPRRSAARPPGTRIFSKHSSAPTMSGSNGAAAALPRGCLVPAASNQGRGGTVGRIDHGRRARSTLPPSGTARPARGQPLAAAWRCRSALAGGSRLNEERLVPSMSFMLK